MRFAMVALAFGLIAGYALADRAGGDRGYPSVTLLSTGTTILGEPIRYPMTGPAQIKAVIITLAPSEKGFAHKHGVPLFAYVLEGEVTVDYAGYISRTYRAGDAFMEAMNVAHFGMNTGAQAVRLLAIYMGAQGSDDVIPLKSPAE
jgi:quercetin dioxygenase-like cupin family protein